jgi:hypothetical protein
LGFGIVTDVIITIIPCTNRRDRPASLQLYAGRSLIGTVRILIILEKIRCVCEVIVGLPIGVGTQWMSTDCKKE